MFLSLSLIIVWIKESEIMSQANDIMKATFVPEMVVCTPYSFLFNGNGWSIQLRFTSLPAGAADF
jgi:hypothetical protein